MISKQTEKVIRMIGNFFALLRKCIQSTNGWINVWHEWSREREGTTGNEAKFDLEVLDSY